MGSYSYRDVRILEQWCALLENVEGIFEHSSYIFEHLDPILEDETNILELHTFIRSYFILLEHLSDILEIRSLPSPTPPPQNKKLTRAFHYPCKLRLNNFLIRFNLSNFIDWHEHFNMTFQVLENSWCIAAIFPV